MNMINEHQTFMVNYHYRATDKGHIFTTKKSSQQKNGNMLIKIKIKRVFKERMWRDTNGPCFGDCSMTRGCIVPHYALSTMCSLVVMIYSFKGLEWWSGEVFIDF